MLYSFGNVVLVPFPFTDQAGTKKRPAVIVSSDTYNVSRRDLIIMAITSQIRQPLDYGEALITEWQHAGLIKTSVFKPVFTTIEQSLVIRTMGKLAKADMQTLHSLIGEILN